MASADWSFRVPPELEEQAGRTLDQLLVRIQALEPTLLGTPPTVHHGSALGGDDRAMAPLHVSATARTPLIVALDHLVLHGAALREVPRIQPFASYSLLRPAIEGAAWAIWILAPARRDERVLRALQYVLLDQLGAVRLLAAGGVTPQHTLDELKDELAEIAARQPALAKSAMKQVPTAREVVGCASREVGKLGAGGLVFWTALSGLAHGRPHAISALTRREQLSDGADGAFESQVFPSRAVIASGTAVALAYVETGLDLYASRCARPA